MKPQNKKDKLVVFVIYCLFSFLHFGQETTDENECEPVNTLDLQDAKIRQRNGGVKETPQHLLRLVVHMLVPRVFRT